ncbi:outer membrane beta-barrel protein [Mucilaginibacter achroorhodeus]|uniref:Outer membrane beta-barrel protein n=1 Tax=Mucilaginibacter achroorhodeus TaxID=2599294 RepID=A0A563U1Q1_9SPHI|nr:TonB-dependent receptor [Mucilaginibacter achroorhodeus]TWR25546.1 outer membrane beta-barrel protein [Mucilaginibacter achroorhodeus]
MFKYLLLLAICFITTKTFAQKEVPRAVMGGVIDSLGAVPGVTVKLKAGKDSVATVSDVNGKFNFPTVGSKNFSVTISGIGYQTITRKYVMDNATGPVVLDPIKLKVQLNFLQAVNIVAVNPITIKEDTVEYKASAYKVREGSPVEDVLKKLPGVSVDKDGNVTAHGKQVTKVRVNGKDYFSGDVQTATQNLPANIVENIQVIDDYGDQANLTGIKTGDPDKILNITIQKGKRTGKFGQATVGAGNDDRYLARLSANAFKEDRQVSVIGTWNNTNTNSFNLGAQGGSGGRAGGGGSSGGVSTANGVTTNRSLGFNYRDEWGKKVTAYGSYSFSDRDRLITNTSQTQNLFQSGALLNDDNTIGRNNTVNHRFDFNIEYRIDTVNYLKINPNFSYSSSNDNTTDVFTNTRNGRVINGNELALTNAKSPNGGVSVLYNHKFKKKGRNFSINTSLSFSKTDQGLNDQYTTRQDTIVTPLFQQINTDNQSSRVGVNLSYIEPLGKTTFLEGNYAFSRNNTDNNRYNYRIDPQTGTQTYVDSLSTLYNYQFTTNKFGLNLRGVKTKYNYTIGMAVQPATLTGESHNFTTTTNTFNLIPTARFIYNFKRNHTLSINYSGSNNQPSFTQLQLQPDFSNPQNRVYGNPNLKPEFSNNIALRYNQFDIASGDALFANLSFNKTQNKIVTNTQPITGIGIDATRFVQETRYLNTSGYYSANGNYSFSKPFANRKFTATLNGGASFNNNINFIEDQRNEGKNWVFNQGAKLRIDIDSLMDTEVSGNYSINSTRYSLPSSINTDAKTWALGLDGRNYFLNDFVLGYNLTQTINKGFSATVKANPTLLSTYVEYQFLKNHLAVLRFQAFDLFNQNTGVSRVVSGNQIIDTRSNRLGRYFMLSFTMRLQKFAGRQGGRGNFGGGRRGRNRG